MSHSSSPRRAGSRLALAALLSAPLVLLSACGGGGGGGDSTPPVVATQVAITSTNQKLVAADALDSATNVDAARSGSSFVTGVQIDTGAVTGDTMRLASVARVLAAKAPASLAQATGVALNETIPCSSGGSMTVSGNVSGGNAIVQGDQVTISTNNCIESVYGVTSTMNGSLSIRITAGSFDPNLPSYPSHITMAIVATNFSITINGQTESSNGDMLIDLTETSATVSSATVSGSSLASTGGRSYTLKNYSQQVGMDNGATTYRVSATVEATNGRLGSGTLSYTVSMPSAMTTDASGQYTAGSLKVVGASNASVLLTVTAANTLKLELDANGDGTYEASTTVTLTELRAQL